MVMDDLPDNQARESVMATARQILRVRREALTLQYLASADFRFAEGTNNFDDEFELLVARIPLPEYERFREVASEPETQDAFRQIANVLQEIGTYIRFVAVELMPVSVDSWDVFICHASEDRQEIAIPLYTHLDSVGIRCWLDQGEIRWGDSIVSKINEGLRSAQFVIVVISQAFLQKPWPTTEMNSVLSQEIDSGITRVLPLMVGTDEEARRMAGQLPLQRDKKYLRWSGNLDEIEQELRVVIRRQKSR